MKRIATFGIVFSLVFWGAGLAFSEEQIGTVGKSGFFRFFGGLGIAGVSPSSDWNKAFTPLSFGFGYEFGRGWMSYEFDLMHMKKGERAGWAGDVWNSAYDRGDTFSILSLNVLMRFRILTNPSVYLLLGDATGIIYDAEYFYESEWGGDQFTYTPDSRIDVNLIFGAGIGRRVEQSGPFLELRYYLGLTKIESNSKYHLFLLLAGYRF